MTDEDVTTYAGDDPVNESDPLGLWGWNPISDVDEAASDAYHHAKVISVVASAVALLPIPGVDVVAGTVAVVAGGIAAGQDAAAGNWTSAGLDAVGVVGGIGALSKSFEAASWLRTAQDEFASPTSPWLLEDSQEAAESARSWSLTLGAVSTSAYLASWLGLRFPGDRQAGAAEPYAYNPAC